MTRTVHVVPHTHWDREWYSSFQTFRLRLVDLLDDLLPRMEADPAYARFLLDGQLAVVDDYLAVRPEAEEPAAPPGRQRPDRRRALVHAARTSSWSSGETLVRNLQLGLRAADRFGGAMPVGYLPDMFGHVAQMPQILAGFGFEHAVVWRGVPAAVDRSGFWWQAPDGTTVRAEYLPQGYGNGSALPDDAKAFVAAARRVRPASGATSLVGPRAVDERHRPPDAPALAGPGGRRGQRRSRTTSTCGSCRCAEHLAAAPTEGLPDLAGRAARRVPGPTC